MLFKARITKFLFIHLKGFLSIAHNLEPRYDFVATAAAFDEAKVQKQELFFRMENPDYSIRDGIRMISSSAGTTAENE